uniref:Uncharacterized protein n=1 Tax=Anguilla anguilla TaxID=7936 RepID=A0A0E9PC83_ANGAN
MPWIKTFPYHKPTKSKGGYVELLQIYEAKTKLCLQIYPKCPNYALLQINIIHVFHRKSTVPSQETHRCIIFKWEPQALPQHSGPKYPGVQNHIQNSLPK